MKQIFFFFLFLTIPFLQDNSPIVLFKQTFEDNTPGQYLRSEWAEDWKPLSPIASDPRPQHWESYGQLKIVEEKGNKFMRREVKTGESGTGEFEGCNWFVDIDDVDEIYFSYKVRFPTNMFFQGKHIEGKLNGLYNPYSKTPVGHKPDRNSGFNSLLMFRNTKDFKNIEIYLYTYYQEMGHNACASEYPVELCPDSDKIYYGNYQPVHFFFDPETWYTITQRCVMNDPGLSNGIIEIFIDGELKASYNHFTFRDNNDVKIEYLEISNFFGGGKSAAPAFPTYFDFDDFTAFSYKESSEIPRGTRVSQSGRRLPLP